MTQHSWSTRTGAYQRSVAHLHRTGPLFRDIHQKCYSCSSARAWRDLLHSADWRSDDYKRDGYERERLCTW